MRLIAPLLVLAAAVVALVATPARTSLLGLDHQTFAAAAMLVALLIFVFGWTRAADVWRAAGAAAIWAALLITLTGVYAYRSEVSDFVGRVEGEFFPSEPQVGQGGEVIVNRRLNGEFAIAARVNGVRVTFLFDTGASAVVLTAADARRVGVNAGELDYDVPVTTANGAALAAQVRLDQIAVGPIVMRDVCALVVRSGALDESLLGMSFLERLRSYSVERGRLILTAK